MSESTDSKTTTIASHTLRDPLHLSPPPPSTSIYNFSLPDADNHLIDFTQFHNKVLLIVNVASLCGFTPQYHELQQLYDKYHAKGLEILGFPCNQFGNQEPQSDHKIASQCRRDFGVKFPIMKKTKVNGEDQSALYQFLKDAKCGMFGFKGVRWNFEKFIINRKGDVVARFDSWITPSQFDGFIQKLLDEGEES
ncbi:Glutathione peroxidase-like peroxiredoxin GPX3 [Candida parapsilosis]|uniref:Glutathione peroxidase n=2 Tax=Candida parapsilosis TaxID=5480 RepID=G8BEC8_CANPC|nr:uncharacterized protein CPAR2_212690 [Candida parapsilosis]KAF6054226.1 Glutathione peroxidase-like peroxiredoxin GPX3 [Candida parapsilosis]KAF6056750.1 Glutathione peroxidase-like peroxiredoxin GPX3 [Candida parapsilosis]KAF6059685.1 Glutathione peroxidase-like peroxiredoxin GPX3 [Candida parapsilosis]KAF6068438.1 Glutathione peroxidase-like peroxiredoxin GPX3 [Candida parapsilosis]KAI5901979.1 Glutathione peroxidase-like peroxiredoxin GPX3 [Candida parapsilosis]